MNHEQLRELARLCTFLRGAMKTPGPAPKCVVLASACPDKVDAEEVKKVMAGYFDEVANLTKYGDEDRRELFKWVEKDRVTLGLMFGRYLSTKKVSLALIRYEE